MNQRISVIAAVCALTAVPAVASAQDQPWLRDRRYTEGIGFRVGDFELHPGAGAEFGYDSNYFHRADDERGGEVSSLRLRITPSFSVSTISQQRRTEAPGPPPDVEFRGTVSATYHEFFPLTGDQASQDGLREQRNVSGDLNLSLSIMPGRTWSGGVTAGVSRALTASNEGLASVGFNRILPRAGAEVAFTPGGGLLDWRLGYGFSGTFFESGNFGGLSNMQHEIQTRGRWRFLPRTALMYDARLGFINYPNATGKTGSHPLRALIGVNGLVTPAFSVLALVGWGASFYTPTPQEDFNSVIGRLELKWFLSPNAGPEPGKAVVGMSSVALGFSRDFADSYIGTYYERDRGYANFSYMFGGRFLTIVEGGAGPIIYPAIPGLGLLPFTDVRIDASLFGEYRLTNYFGINTTVRYGQNISGTSVQGPGGPVDQLEWKQIEAYLGARWFM